MCSLNLRALVLVIATSAITSCASMPRAVTRTPVEVWRPGCCGLTLRLRDALEAGLQASAWFELAVTAQPNALVIVIPDVNAKPARARLEAIYSVDFTTVSGERLGTSSGSCWDDELSKCVDHIIRDATIAARKIH